MSDDERAALLSKYMDQLREKYPSTPDDKIRAKAEELVEKKLGPETPAKPPERSPSPDSIGTVRILDSAESASIRQPAFSVPSLSEEEKRRIEEEYAKQYAEEQYRQTLRRKADPDQTNRDQTWYLKQILFSIRASTVGLALILLGIELRQCSAVVS